MRKSLLARISGLLEKPRDERKRALRRIRQRMFAAPLRLAVSPAPWAFVSYQPDSHYIFGAHPEFDALFDRFTAHNKGNNGGDASRLWSLILNVKQVLGDGIPGDFAEVGVWKGNTAAVLARLAVDRQVYLFDTFAGFNIRDIQGIDANKDVTFDDTSLELVKEVVGRERTNCHYVPGWFPASASDEHRQRQYAVVSLDCDLYQPMKAGLEFFYPRMARGGIMFLHDYSSLYWDGAKLAVDEFCAETGEFIVLMPDKSGSAFLRRSRS
jgi:hypothetical protein